MYLSTGTFKEGQVDIKRILQGAIEEIGNYTAILVLPDYRNGSGVYVNVCGLHGILTAWHVAREIFKAETFSLCVAKYEHFLEVKSANCEHITLGENPNESELGPDLSFIVIRDENLLSILRSKKSFCVLESQPLSRFGIDLKGMRWAVAGSPHNFKKSVVEKDNKIVVTHCDMVGVADFVGREVRNYYDYVQIRFPSDQTDKFPTNYEGMSGGGLWAIGFTGNPPNYDLASITYQKPVLAGIVFYQSAPVEGWITLTGHGFDSIYRNAVKTIMLTSPNQITAASCPPARQSDSAADRAFPAAVAERGR